MNRLTRILRIIHDKATDYASCELAETATFTMKMQNFGTYYDGQSICTQLKEVQFINLAPPYVVSSSCL